LEDHEKYMEKLVKNPNAYQWIIVCDGEDVGHIKIVNLEFGSMIKDGFRGKGIGKVAYELVFKEAKNLGLKKLTATVKIDRATPSKFETQTGWEKKKILRKNEKPYAYTLERIL
jgi:predicted acetyltransferase